MSLFLKLKYNHYCYKILYCERCIVLNSKSEEIIFDDRSQQADDISQLGVILITKLPKRIFDAVSDRIRKT